MWLVDAIRTGFDTPLPRWLGAWFTVAIGVACLWKFGWDFASGGWRRMRPGSYLRHAFARQKVVPPRLAGLYRPVLTIRTVAALVLVLGPTPRLAALVIAGALWFELGYEFRYHTIYLAIGCAIVATMGDLPTSPLLGLVNLDRTRAAGNTWAIVLVTLTSVQIYLASAYRKIRSPQFRSGRRLYAFFWGATAALDKRPEPQLFVPEFIRRGHREPYNPVWLRRWRVGSVVVIGLELGLPIALLMPGLWAVAALVGLLMHAGFLLLKPFRLVPFAIASVAAYPCYIATTW
jgi:hypothetical protein